MKNLKGGRRRRFPLPSGPPLTITILGGNLNMFSFIHWGHDCSVTECSGEALDCESQGVVPNLTKIFANGWFNGSTLLTLEVFQP